MPKENLFGGDELINVVMRFRNPDANQMQEASKTLGRIYTGVEKFVEKSLQARKTVGEISTSIARAINSIDSFSRSTAARGTAPAQEFERQMASRVQNVLKRFTPTRLENMAATFTGSDYTVGDQVSNQLEGELRKIAQTGKLAAYRAKAQKSRYGTGVSIDLERTKAGQIAELSAIRFQYDRLTGEVVKAQEAVYTATQNLAKSMNSRNERRWLGPKFAPGELENSRGISPTRLKHITKGADFLAGHWLASDMPALSGLVPGIASVPRVDTTNIPWRLLGSKSGALQDVVRMYGLQLQGRAHRAYPDARAVIDLLGSRHPQGVAGSPTTLGMLIARRLGTGPGGINTSRDQGVVDVLIERAREIHRNIGTRLSAPAFIQGLEDLENLPALGGRKVPQSRAKSDTTPGPLGEEAISLDARMGTAATFMRNALIMPRSLVIDKYASAVKKLETYAKRSGPSAQLGEDFEIAVMREVNAALDLERRPERQASSGAYQRVGRKAKSIEGTRIGEVVKAAADEAHKHALPEVDAFIQSVNTTGASGGAHYQTALKHLGAVAANNPNDPRIAVLGGILADIKKSAGRRTMASTSILNRTSAEDSGTASSVSAAMDRALGKVVTNRGPSNLTPQAGSIDLDLLTLGVSAFVRHRQQRRALNARLAAVREARFTDMRANPGAYDATAADELSLGPSYVRDRLLANRGSNLLGEVHQAGNFKQRSAIEELLARFVALDRTVARVNGSLERYETVVDRRARDGVNASAAAQTAAANRSFGRFAESARYNEAVLMEKRATSAALSNLRKEADDRRVASRAASLEARAQLAQDAFESAAQFSVLRAEKYSTSAAGQKLRESMPDSAKREMYLDQLFNAPVRAKERLAIRARYDADIAGLSDPSAIAAVRLQSAKALALSRMGLSTTTPDTSPQLLQRLDEFEKQFGRSHASLGGSSAASELAAKRAAQQVKDASEARLDSLRAGRNESRLQQAREDRDRRADDAETRRRQRLSALDERLDRRREAAATRLESIEQRRVAAANRLAGIAGGGGGSGFGGGGSGASGSGAAGSGGVGWGSRGGMDFGVGLASLAAYGSAMNALIKDIVVYTARTETMELTTEQMAKVNGLNVASVNAQVEAVKRLNITTQEAHTTVQKMMFAQLDVAKATNLARVAQDVAILSNKNSSEALEKIILGIVTGQTRILHNLNLQVSLAQVIRDLRAGKKASGDKGEPTELEKREAMLNRVLMEGTKVFGVYERAMLTAGKQYNSLRREAQEAANAIGREFLPEFGLGISLMTQFFRGVQNNGTAVSGLISLLASLGTSLSAIGTISFVRWVMASPAIPLPAKLVGAAVGLGTFAAMNFGNERSMKLTAGQAREMFDTQLASRRKELAQLEANRPGRNATPDEIRNWEFTRDYLKAQVAREKPVKDSMREQLASQLVDEYSRRVKENSASVDAMFLSGGGGSSAVSKYALGAALGLMTEGPMKVGRSTMALFTGDYGVPSSKEYGITQAEILKRYNEQKNKSTTLTPSMQMRAEMKAESDVARMISIDARIEELMEQHQPLGRARLRLRKSMGAPLEKNRLAMEAELAEVDKLREFQRLEAQATSGDAGAKVRFETAMKRRGAGDYNVGYQLYKERTSQDIETVEKDIRTMYGENEGKIRRQAQAAIRDSQERLIVQRASYGVAGTGADKELELAEKIRDIRLKGAREHARLMEDSLGFTVRAAEIESEYQGKLLEIDERRLQTTRRRVEEDALAAGALRGRAILERTGLTSEQARLRVLEAELEATKAIADETKRDDAQRAALERYDAGRTSDSRDIKRIRAEAGVREFGDYAELAAEMDRVVSGRGRGTGQRALDEIDRARKLELERARREYDAELENAPIGGVGSVLAVGYRAKYDESVRRTNTSASRARVQELDRQVEARRQAVIEDNQTRFQRMERVSQLRSRTGAEEYYNADQLYKYRVQLIEEEYKTRGENIDALEQKEKQLQEAKFDRLQRYLQTQKQEIESIRSAAGSIFDAMLTKGSEGIKELLMGQLRVTGRTVFQNAAGLMFANLRPMLGNIIGGQVDRTGKPTFLGNLLSGTMFAKSKTEDINRLLTDVTGKNVLASNRLREAIDALTQEMQRAQRSVPSGTADDIGGILGGVPRSVAPGGAPGSNLNVGSAANRINKISNLVGELSSFVGSSAPQLQQATSTVSRISNIANGVIGGGAGGGIVGTLIGMFSGGKATAGGGLTSPGQVSGIPLPGGGSWTVPYATAPIGSKLEKGASSASQFIGGLFGGANPMQYNAFDLFSGASSVRTGAGKATAMTGSQKAGAIAGKGLAVAMGAMQLVSGIKEGGARGGVGAAAGALNIAAQIPGPQQPFIMAGAAVLSLVHGMMGDSKESRRKDIESVLTKTRYIEPVKIEHEVSASGEVMSYNKYGKARATGDRGLPIDVVPTEWRKSTAKGAGENDFVEVPGYVVDQRAGRTGAPQQITINVDVPVNVNAMDTQSFLARSGDIARALQKEISSGSGVSQSLQDAIFGV